jgi:HK97 family phage portal protein
VKVFGFDIQVTRAKAMPQDLSSINSHPGIWQSVFGLIQEPYAGAWQRNVVVAPTQTLLAFSAVYACVTGIACDIAKLRVKLVRRDTDGIWNEVTDDSPWLSVLEKPNRYQTRIKFIEQWILSKLLYGNAYILKERDQRGIVNALYVIHPNYIKPLVSEDGGIYYEICRDWLNQNEEERKIVPASEVIHDMMVSLWHPLVGVSPIYACGLSATMGNAIQSNSTKFFANRSMPGGMLTAPGAISTEVATRLKTTFETNFSGDNMGKLFVAGDGLEFKQFSITAIDAQLIEQLGWTVQDVARSFHYPMEKLGGPPAPYSTTSNTEARTMAYYTDCLQTLIESLELCLDEGLRLPRGTGTEMDLDNLWRMDTLAMFEANNKAISGGWLTPNEARSRANLRPVSGGDTPYLQQQNYSLQALAKRDQQENPFEGSSS